VKHRIRDKGGSALRHPSGRTNISKAPILCVSENNIPRPRESLVRMLRASCQEDAGDLTDVAH